MANEFKIKKGLIVTGASGGTVVDIQGSQGQLFSVTDDLSGSIFAVSDISGVPILDVNSSGLSTFTGNIAGNTNNTTEVGTYSTGAIKRIRMVQGGELHFGDTTTAAPLGITEGDWNQFADQDRLSIYGRNSIKFYSGGISSALQLTLDTNATFVGDVLAPRFDIGTDSTSIIQETNRMKFTNSIANDAGGFDFYTRKTDSSYVNALQILGTGDSTFATQAFSAATSSGDASSTLTTKGYVDGLITGATIYRGAWDPSGGGYGSPDLSGVTQTSGYYYICSADGTAEPNGTGTEPDTWAVGDWVIYNDVSGTGQWQKIDNSSVLSGVGTGQTVALWEGAGSVTDSETLGNAPITVSGSDTTFAGDVVINSAGDATSPILRLNNSSSNTFNHALEAINDNLTAAQTELLLFGKETNSRNSGFIGYNWNADNSDTNYVTIGHWGYNHLLKIYPTGTATFVGSVTSPTFLGDLNGTINTATTGTTQTAGTNSTLIATTAYADAAAGAVPIGNYLPLAGGTMTGNVVFPGEEANSFKIAFTGASASSGLSTVDQSGAGLYIGANSRVNNSGVVVFHDTLLPSSGIYFDGWSGDDMEFYTGSSGNPTKRLTIEAGGDAIFTGNVGIGTTAPSNKLSLAGSGQNWVTSPAIKMWDSYNSKGWYVGSANNATIGDFYIRSVTAEGAYPVSADQQFTIKQSGNVGIGTTSPSRTLDVRTDSGALIKGATGSVDGKISLVPASGGRQHSLRNRGASFELYDDSAGSSVMYWKYGGNVGIGTTTPSAKLEVESTTTIAYNPSDYNSGSILTLKSPNADTNYSSIRFSNSAGNYEKFIGSVQTGTNTADIVFQGYDRGAGIYKEYARIAENGNVGIGTTTPNAKLDIQGTQGQLFSVTDNLSGSIFAVADISGVPIFDVNSSGVSYFDGNVGIGTTSPASKLQVGDYMASNVLTIGGWYGGGGGTLAFKSGYVPNAAYVWDTARIKATDDGNFNGRIEFQTSTSGRAAPDTKMVLKATGNLGIGVTNPHGKLSFENSVETRKIVLYETGNNAFQFYGFGIESNALIYNTAANTDDHIFFSGASTATRNELMRIEGTGNVGIGTTSPDAKLDIEGDFEAGYALKFTNTKGTGSVSGFRSHGTNGEVTSLYRNSTEIQGWNQNGTSYFDGNVGIGTGSPTSALGSAKVLDISSTGNGEVILDHTDAGVSSDLGLYSWARNNDHLAHIKATCEGATDAAFISFHAQPSGGSFSNAASNEKMRIQSNGYVGIGTTSPDLKLDVVSGLNNGIRISATDTTSNWRDISIRSYVSETEANALGDNTHIYTTSPIGTSTETPFSYYGATVIQGRNNGNGGLAIRLGNGSGHSTMMWMGSTGVTVFSNTVTATNFILSSDERLKENIEKACDNRIKADWKTFELKTDKGQKRYGVIAQELEKTNPEFVREDTQGFKSVAYIDLLIAKIAELEARLEKAGI